MMNSAVIAAIAQGLLATGAIMLVWALIPVRRLMAQFPPGTARNCWHVMIAMILLLLLGYLSYAASFWDRHTHLLDLIAPGVFFLGACSVWFAATLLLKTTTDPIHITRLEQEIITDSLTGVFNRRYLDRRLDDEVASARRYKQPLSVMLLDIDHFKQINDQYGHQTGDQVLIALGEIATEVLRETDVLTRYGGEEFLILSPHTPLAGAIKLAERLRQHIEAYDFGLPRTLGATPSAKVTASIGVAVLDSDTGTAGSLVRAADESLYRAKQQGRNRVIADAPDGAAPQASTT